jgi:ATP-binding cassette subfamily B protein
VTFYYEKDKPVLSHFSLHVKAGETIALVGPTGAGKSTIANLACRFYEPCAGEIWLDGKNLTRYSLQSLHSRLAVVLQTPHLFSGTIRENIRYGCLEATDKEVETAARKAHAHEFIATLKHGYDEEVGEGGVRLSVGQKQLLSISRAILSQPDILIMDEATSSVDTLTETLIQRGLQELMRACTSFVIAHRLSTIKSADRILFIDNGQIIEEGSHQALIRRRGYYYRLYAEQFRLEREKGLLGSGDEMGLHDAGEQE